MKTSSLISLFIGILVLSCGEEKVPVIKIDLPKHVPELVQYQAVVKKQNHRISVDLGFHQLAPIVGLENLSFITVPIIHNVKFGESHFHDQAKLKRIEKEIIHLIDSSFLGFYVGKSESTEEIDFYVYTSDKLAWKSEVEKLKMRFPKSGISEISKEDRAWTSYFSYLSPNEEQGWIIKNKEQKRKLLEKGYDLSEIQTIYHTFYFRTTYNRDRTIKDLSRRGYKVVELDLPTGNKKHPFYVKLAQNVVLMDAKFDQNLIELWELSKQRYSLYQGWEISEIEHK